MRADLKSFMGFLTDDRPRVVIHIDMDAFYAGVEQALRPELKGLPVVVVQYNQYKGGGIIAVSYEARKFGVKRIMRGDEALKLCPELQLIQVPTHHGKADLRRYREVSERVLATVRRYAKTIEKTSVDEMYVDLTNEVEDWLLRQGSKAQFGPITSLPHQHQQPINSPKSSIFGQHPDDINQSLSLLPNMDCDDTDDVFSEEEIEFTESDWPSPPNETLKVNEYERDVIDDLNKTNNDIGQELCKNIKETEIIDDMNKNDDKGPMENAIEVHVLGVDPKNTVDWLTDIDSTADKYDKYLKVASAIVAEIRAAVLKETGCSCSAGIAPNKMLAKLCSQLHKPNQQTIVFPFAIPSLLSNLPIGRIRFLGGKFGKHVQSDLNVETIGQVAKFSLAELCSKYGEKRGEWLYGLCLGHDPEPVKILIAPKTIGCSKSFPGPMKLMHWSELSHWLSQLANELIERLELDTNQRSRLATQLTIIVPGENMSTGYSKTAPFHFTTTTTVDDVARKAMALVSKLYPACTGESDDVPLNIGGFRVVGLSASKFVSIGGSGQPKATTTIKDFFTQSEPSSDTINPNNQLEFSIICDRCHQPIHGEVIEEHSDWHVACDLLESLNKEPTATSMASGTEGKRPGVNSEQQKKKNKMSKRGGRSVQPSVTAHKNAKLESFFCRLSPKNN